MDENKKVEDLLNDKQKQVCQGFSIMWDIICGNDSGTKAFEEFMKQNASVLKKESGGK